MASKDDTDIEKGIDKSEEPSETKVGTMHELDGRAVDPEKAGTYPEIDFVAEKKLLRKIDINLITLFGALYLMSFLGKPWVHNANHISLLTTYFQTDLTLAMRYVLVFDTCQLRLVLIECCTLESHWVQHRSGSGEQPIWRSSLHCLFYLCGLRTSMDYFAKNSHAKTSLWVLKNIPENVFHPLCSTLTSSPISNCLHSMLGSSDNWHGLY